MKQGNIRKEEFIRVGTTLYKLVNQPRLNGDYVRKRIVWNNETLRQDYGKHYLASVPKYDGFCTVPDHVNYRPIVDKFLNLYKQTAGGRLLAHPIFGAAHLRGTIRIRYGLSATAIPATDSEVAYPAVGIGRT